MSLLNASEASSTSQSIHQVQQDLLDLLLKLLVKLRAERPNQSLGAAAANQLSPTETQQVDSLCAESVKQLVQERGVEQMTEDGLQHVYEAESYSLRADLNDGTGYPVYTITCPNRGELLKFQDSPAAVGEVIFYPTQHELSNLEKAKLLAVLQQSLEFRLQQVAEDRAILAEALDKEPGVSATPAMRMLDDNIDREAVLGQQVSDRAVAVVKADLDSLGGFAPQGSQAILVAHAVLGEQDKAEREENARYSTQRHPDGTIELYEDRLPRPGQAKEPLVTLSPGGELHCTARFTAQHGAAFSAMLTRLAAHQKGKSAVQSRSKLTKTPNIASRDER